MRSHGGGGQVRVGAGQVEAELQDVEGGVRRVAEQQGLNMRRSVRAQVGLGGTSHRILVR